MTDMEAAVGSGSRPNAVVEGGWMQAPLSCSLVLSGATDTSETDYMHAATPLSGFGSLRLLLCKLLRRLLRVSSHEGWVSSHLAWRCTTGGGPRHVNLLSWQQTALSSQSLFCVSWFTGWLSCSYYHALRKPIPRNPKKRVDIRCAVRGVLGVGIASGVDRDYR